MKFLSSSVIVLTCAVFSPLNGYGGGGNSPSTLATPTITWTAPAAITYGTALSATQLNATANYAGTFTYSPASGTVLSAGTQTLNATFTPSDATKVASATAKNSLMVNKATPTITWKTPAAVTVGTALSSTQLDATASFGGKSVAGKFVYSPAAGTVIKTSGSQKLSVTFTPTESADYNSATATVLLTVKKAMPTITWKTPAAVALGTVLSGTQLDATASVAGKFVYSPIAGTVMKTAGAQKLSVTFTPTDSADYNSATATVSLTVKKATPTITWKTPAAVTVGTALSSTQLDATASVAGKFVYSPAAGTVIKTAGSQKLSVAFTPTDSADYNSATATVLLTVNKGTPKITWKTPAAVTVGTALSSKQLDATASVAGTFVYSPIAGTVMKTVGAQKLSVTFTPTDGADYNSATGSVTLTVLAANTTAVTVNIDALANRHQISSFVYGNNNQTISEISDAGYTFSRWGGNDASNYNYLLQTRNSAGDWYYETYGGAGDQAGLITQTQNAGSHALTTMAMMDWVAAEAENSTNRNWSYSVQTFGAQCSVDPYNTDAGNGQKTDCSTPVTTDAVTTAYFPLVDTAKECPSGTMDGSTCVDRETWTKALAAAFNTSSATCPVPYSPITSCHFYDLDNEPDIWSGTHRDVHPAAAGYDELANLYEKEATNLKKWDPAAVRFGPVFCCWWFYWNGSNGADKGNHGSVDFLPWWLNQIKWLDEINGARTLDVFDIHAYADCGPTNGFTNAQLQAATVACAGFYWDPATVNQDTNNSWTTREEPNPGIPFVIPRMKAMVNEIYPGTPLAFTEWGAGLAANSGSDFSTAIADADTLGVFGREGLGFASRWAGPSSGTPAYLAWKMFTNYDGAHHSFEPLSVQDTYNTSSALFTSYASLNTTGTAMTIMVLNKDPKNTAQVTFDLSGFDASTYTAYTLVTTAPSAISASGSAAWRSTQSFAPYSITLLVISGKETSKPSSEWFLNPDDLMIPASGTATLHPAITSGSAKVTLSSAVFDAYEGASACSGGSLTLTNDTITETQPATITVNAGSTSGYCHYTVTGSDGTATQTQGGWIVVGNPPATLTQTGNSQSGSAGTALAQPLTVTLNPGQSGGSSSGAGILFTTSGGTLSNGTTSGRSVIAQTNASGLASVTLKLPSSKGAVTVTAQDQFAFGGASVTFTETVN
jgi:hypothetical protein